MLSRQDKNSLTGVLFLLGRHKHIATLHITRYNVYMPLIQKTVYIREGDIDKWNAISNKAEWLSRRLNDDNTMLIIDKSQIRTNRVKLPKPMQFTDDTTITGDSLKQTVTIDNGKERQTLSTKPSTFDKDIQFCQHGAVKGMCKKGCK